MRVLETLETISTGNGQLKRGKVEVEGQTLRVDCATDKSWVSLHDDSRGDPLAYDVLTSENRTLRSSDQATLTFAWTPEQFAWLQDYIDPPPPPPPPEPMLFIRRPAQGLVPPVTPAEPVIPPPDPQVEEGTRYLFYGVIYLVLGLLCSGAEYLLVRIVGGFFLFTAIRMLYGGRTLAKQLCLIIYGNIKQRL